MCTVFEAERSTHSSADPVEYIIDFDGGIPAGCDNQLAFWVELDIIDWAVTNHLSPSLSLQLHFPESSLGKLEAGRKKCCKETTWPQSLRLLCHR